MALCYEITPAMPVPMHSCLLAEYILSPTEDMLVGRLEA